MVSQDVNWCRSLLIQMEGALWELRMRNGQFHGQLDFARNFWNDSAGQDVMRRRLEPFCTMTDEAGKKLYAHHAQAGEAVDILHTSHDSERLIHRLSEQSKQIRERVGNDLTTIHHLIDSALGLAAKAERMTGDVKNSLSLIH